MRKRGLPGGLLLAVVLGVLLVGAFWVGRSAAVPAAAQEEVSPWVPTPPPTLWVHRTVFTDAEGYPLCSLVAEGTSDNPTLVVRALDYDVPIARIILPGTEQVGRIEMVNSRGRWVGVSFERSSAWIR